MTPKRCKGYAGDRDVRAEIAEPQVRQSLHGRPGQCVQDGGNVIGNTTDQTWYLEYLDQIWSDRYSEVITGDFNGDGRTDILMQSKAIAGMTSIPFTYQPYEKNVLFLADQDGRITSPAQSWPNDYLGVDWCSESTSIFNERGEWYWNTPSSTIVTGDFNGDGRTDLFLQSRNLYSNHKYAVLLADPDGRFTTVHQIWEDNYLNIPWLGHYSNLIPGDYNGDGLTDFFVQAKTDSNSHAILLADPDGKFTAVHQSWSNESLGIHWNMNHSAAIPGDYNGDGRTDILLQGINNNFVNAVILADKDGKFSSINQWWLESYLGINWNWHASHIIPGDFNGDGRTDVLIQSGDSSNTNAILLSNGRGEFLEVHQQWENAYLGINWNRYPSRIIPGDYNGDGRTDVLIQSNCESNTNAIFFSGPSARFTKVHQMWPNDSFGIQWNAFDRLGVSGDFNGDGRTDILLKVTRHISYWDKSGIFFADSGNVTPDLLLGIMNGLTAATAITYAPLTDSSVYSKGSTASYPVLDFQGPLYVVSSYSVSDGIGGEHAVSMEYGNAQVHLRGYGSLGFGWSAALDEETNILTTTYYNQNYPRFTGMVDRMDKELVSSEPAQLLSQVINTPNSIPYHDQRVFFSYVEQSIEKRYELGNSVDPVTTITTVTNYTDGWGNPNHIIITANDGHKKEVANTYNNNESQWFIGRLIREEITTTTPPSQGSRSETRVTTYDYYPDTGFMRFETIEPGTPLWLVTEHEYDSFGTRKLVRVSGPDIETRETETQYDSEGRFPQRVWNALEQMEEREYDARFGQMKKLIGPNDDEITATRWEYDGLGRKTKEIRADGSKTIWIYQWVSDGVPAGACYSITAAVYNVQGDLCAPPVIVYYDILGREIRSETLGSQGRAVCKDTKYDHLGRVEKASQNYFVGDNPNWTEFYYDAIGRIEKEQYPDGTAKTITYAGLETTIKKWDKTQTQVLNRQTNKVDSQGQTVLVTDACDSPTRYDYWPFGSLYSVTDAQGNQTIMVYDKRGRKEYMIDPDMGTWFYSYYANGLLKTQTDAKGNTIQFQYDKLDRLKKKDYPTGTDTEYSYDSYEGQPAVAKGIGRLTKVTDASGSEEYYYDDFGRVWKTVKTVDGVSYPIETGYDPLNRIKSIKYPDGEIVDYNYGADGNLAEVPGYALYTKYNATGQLENATYGNGVTSVFQYCPDTKRLYSITTNSPTQGGLQNYSYLYDDIGNIASWNALLDSTRTQSFTYDSLNRLDTATSSAYGTIDYDYDSIGNMTHNSRVGPYVYKPTYDQTKPHAVKEAGGVSYEYDENGNMINRGGKTITYNYDNMPQEMASTAGTLSFVYDHAGQRVKKNAPSGLSIYIGKWCEYKDSVLTKHIFAGGARIASKTGSTVRYYHTDHLGGVNIVTDASGNKIEAYYYYPFGETRVASGSEDYKYTGKEEDEETGLYYYGARYYDPVLGRFISADTIIPDPLDPQSLNRYSYCLNNPIMLIDADGHNPFLVAMAIGFLAGAVAAGIQSDWDAAAMFKGSVMGGISAGIGYGAGIAFAPSTSWGYYGTVAFSGTVSGVIGSAIEHGNILQGALIGAIAACASACVAPYLSNLPEGAQYAGRALVGGVIGGISAELYGGDFGQGFVTGAAAAAAACMVEAGIEYSKNEKYEILKACYDSKETYEGFQVAVLEPEQLKLENLGQSFDSKAIGTAGLILNEVPILSGAYNKGMDLAQTWKDKGSGKIENKQCAGRMIKIGVERGIDIAAKSPSKSLYAQTVRMINRCTDFWGRVVNWVRFTDYASSKK